MSEDKGNITEKDYQILTGDLYYIENRRKRRLN